MTKENFIYYKYSYNNNGQTLLTSAEGIANVDFTTHYIGVYTSNNVAVTHVTNRLELADKLKLYPPTDYSKLFTDTSSVSLPVNSSEKFATNPSEKILEVEQQKKPKRKQRVVKENATNKTRVSKQPMRAVPPIASFALGLAMEDGAEKYGLFNFRKTEVTASIFYEKMKRHLEEWYSGQSFASDSKKHHLAHLMANAAIVLDAELCGVFIDDRDATPVDFKRVLEAPDEKSKNSV